MSKQTIIARPYAKAVFELAIEQGSIKTWAELLQMAAFVIKQPMVQDLLDNPRISAKQACDFLMKVCSAKLTKEGENFFKTLAERDRLSVIPEIAELFEIYRAEQEKQMKVMVTSALPLTQEEQHQLMHALKKRLQREIILTCQVDNGLIGGLIIQADDLVMDGSVRGKLARLQAELMS